MSNELFAKSSTNWVNELECNLSRESAASCIVDNLQPARHASCDFSASLEYASLQAENKNSARNVVAECLQYNHQGTRSRTS